MDEVIKRIKASDKIKIIDTVNSNNDRIVDSIINLCIDNKLVPVICDDMFEYKDPLTGELQFLHSYIVEKIIGSVNTQIELSEKELSDIVKENYYGISLLESKLDRRLYKDIYNKIVQNGNIIDGVQLKEGVAEFLEICNFPLIITTNCFEIIEQKLQAHGKRKIFP